MGRLIIPAVLLLATVTLLSCTRPESDGTLGEADSTKAAFLATAKEYYTCAMHPSVVSDRPGLCPICGMPLIKKKGPPPVASAKELALITSVSLSPTQRVIANVSTIRAERSSFRKEINAVGVVDYAEPLQATVAARFRGRIEKLLVDFTGQVVRKGQPLFELYSPDLVSAEQDLVLAVNALGHSPESERGEGQQRLLQASRDRLQANFGVTAQQIEDIEQTKHVQRTVTFNSPIQGTVLSKEVQQGQYVDEGMVLYQLADLSKVWIYLDVYEKDMRFVKPGRPVRITTEAYPDETFTGKVTFVDPVLNSETRTVRVRTEFDNSSGKLKPQMFVKATLSIPVNGAIVVPASAVLSTGRRDIVWIEVRPNTFEPRTVELGVRSESACEVLGGLNAGDSVVVSGGFMLESESELEQPFGRSTGAGSAPQMAQESHATPPAPQAEVAKAQDVNILVNGLFVPDVIHAKKGQPLRLNFYREEESGCINEVVFESLHIRRPLASLRTTTISLTPDKAGEIPFMCGMGMVKGKVVVE